MKMKAQPTVGIVLTRRDYKLDKIKVLLVEHEKGSKHLKNTVGLPAGRIEAGETEIEAALRELREETALRANELTILPRIFRARMPRKNGRKVSMTMKVAWCTDYSGDVKKTEEANPIWVLLEDVATRKYNLVPNVRAAIKYALTHGEKERKKQMREIRKFMPPSAAASYPDSEI